MLGAEILDTEYKYLLNRIWILRMDLMRFERHIKANINTQDNIVIHDIKLMMNDSEHYLI